MLVKAHGVVVSAEELDVRAEQGKVWLSQCFAPFCIPLMPTSWTVSCPEGFYSFSSALGVSCWFQAPWEVRQVLFVVPEKCHQDCGATNLLLRQMWR